MNQTRRHSRTAVRTRKPPYLVIIVAVLLLGAVLYAQLSHGRSPSDTDLHTEQELLTQLEQDYPDLVSQLDKDSYYPPELLEMLEKNSETLDYVKNYPTLHNQTPDIDLSEEANSEEIPLLLQWDTRWGYRSYGGGLIGYTGCGPTCLSMVALYLTGNSEYTPAAIADYAEKNGYYAKGAGSSWTLMSEASAAFDLSAEELPLDENRMISALSEGRPIICSMGPGDFTTTGHYIVLTGYEDGEFTVNDPNSVQRSGERWSYDRISGQIRNLWAMSKAD